MYHYYLTVSGKPFPDFVPESGHPVEYAGIRDMILERAETRPVFFKDMAYYVVDDLAEDAAFTGQMSHAFLLRDPCEAAFSYARKDPEFSLTELGFEAQHRLYHALVEQGHSPLILTADQLREEPERTLSRYWKHAGLGFAEHAFSWDDRVPEGWKSVQSWHDEVLQSGAIKKPAEVDASAQLAKLGPPYTDYVTHHLSFYTELLDIAEAQAHQK